MKQHSKTDVKMADVREWVNATVPSEECGGQFREW
jgi:hypothetical protein